MAASKSAQNEPVSRGSKYAPELFNVKSFQERLSAFQDTDEYREILVEDAGFEPLDVKLWKMYQAGVRAQLNVEDLTMQDLRSIYLDPDFSVDEDDDLEEIALKYEAQQEYMQRLRALRQGAETESVETERQDLRSQIGKVLDERLTAVRGEQKGEKASEQAEK